MEEDLSFSLDVSPEVNFSRPSIDVFFKSVAKSIGKNVVGVLISGAGFDGAEGLEHIHLAGGKTIVQSPEEAEFDVMPKAALQRFTPSYVFRLEEIASFLIDLANEKKDF